MIRCSHYHKLILLFLVILQSCFNYKINHKMKYNLDFYTQYNNFDICSDNNAISALSTSAFSDTAYNDRLYVLKNLLIVRTESYGHIKGELAILDSANSEINYNKYDHIVEGGIEVKSGVLQVHDCPFSTIKLEIKIKPGTYRVRIYCSNMVGFDNDEDEGNDFYEIEIWPDTNMERKVLKQYVGK
jgi:hypothetical protein